MPSLTLSSPSLQAEGPIIDVLFLISTELEEKYKKDNQEPPKPVSVRALIDTGASHCVIKKEIPEQLGLKPVGSIKINTPSSKDHQCYQYFMRMAIPAHELVYEGVFTAAPLEGQNIACLIGRDLLANGILIYIGYAQQFTFSLM